MPAEIVAPVPRIVELYDEQFARVLAGAGAVEVVDAVVAGCVAVTAALVVDGNDCEVVRSPAGAMVDPRRDRWVIDVVTLGRRSGEPVVVPRCRERGVPSGDGGGPLRRRNLRPRPWASSAMD